MKDQKASIGALNFFFQQQQIDPQVFVFHSLNDLVNGVLSQALKPKAG